MKRTSPLGLAGALAAGVAVALALAACGASTPDALVKAGQQADAKKDYKAAVLQYKSALQTAPNSAETRFLVGQALLNAGDPAAAVVELTKALDQQVPPARVMPLLSRALLLTGDYKRLTTQYGNLVLDDKRAQAALKCNLARAWGAQDDSARTAAAVADALAAEPDFPPAKLLNASLMAGRGQLDAASALVAQVLAQDPSLYEGWMLKGEIELAKAQTAQAAASFEKALSIEPAYVPAHVSLLSMELTQGRLDAAKARAAKLRKMLPGHPQTQFVDALVAYFEKDFPKAKESVQEVLRVLPDSVPALQLAGVIEGQMGSLVLANSQLSKALSLSPRDPGVRVNLARVQLAAGQPARALETLQPLLGETGGSSEASAVAGDAMLRLGDADGAAQSFRRAAELNPSDVRLQTSVALAQLAHGDGTAAFNALATLSQNNKDSYPDLALVSARMARGQQAQALQALDALDKKSPNDPKSLELRGRVLAAAGDDVGARAAFVKAQQLDPRLFSVTASLVELDVMQKKPDEAVKRLQAVIAAEPRNYYARLLLSDVRGQNGGTWEERRDILNEAIKVAPSATEPRLQLIDLLLRKRQFKQAVTVAEDAAVAFPGDPAVLEATGRAQLATGNTERAINSFRKLVGMLPNSAVPYLRLAAVYRTGGQRAATETALKKALEIEPASRVAQRSFLDFETDNTSTALAYARELQQKQPSSAGGYLLEGDLHSRLKAPAAAVDASRKGLAAAKDTADLSVMLYNALIAAGRAPEAERFAEQWLKKHPENLLLEMEMGSMALQRGQVEPAQARFEHVLSRQPANAVALNNLAWLLVKAGKPGAVRYAERAVMLTPDSPATLDTLAVALAANQRFPEALEAQQRAVELAPRDDMMRLNLARIAIQAQNRPLARQQLDRLKGLGAAFPAQAEVDKLLLSL